MVIAIRYHRIPTSYFEINSVASSWGVVTYGNSVASSQEPVVGGALTVTYGDCYELPSSYHELL